MQKENKLGQEIYWGTGAVAHVYHYLKENNIGNVVLIRGNTSYKNVSTIIGDSLRGIIVKEMIVSHGLPELAQIRELYNAVKSFLPSCIIGVGGGAVMDTAKTLNHLSMEDGIAASELLVIPTTAGSGSEATPFAVIYEGKKKISLESPALLPKAVFIDVVSTVGMPESQRAISGIDAWCQSIESCWSNRATPDSIDLATKAFHRIDEELPKFNLPVSLKLMMGAYYAGCAIRSTYTTGAHALSYYLTAEHGVPHGQAVAVFLPIMVRYNLQQSPVSAGVKRIMKLLESKKEEQVIEKVMAFIRQCRLKATLKELEVTGLSAELLVDSINHQRFSNNPRPFDREELLKCIHWSLNH